MRARAPSTLSAQVVLRPASGRALDPGQAITASNIREWLPSQDAVDIASRAFRDAGFDVGNVVGNSFSITGPSALFERTFDTRIRAERGGTVKATHADRREAYELPLHALPQEARRIIDAVTFSPPPDFGPTNP